MGYVINLERLRALAAVFAHGSIARAAQALHVTPSGVSQQLSRLEKEAGHQLLEPHGRGVRLTHAGRLLAAHAAAVMAEVAAAEADLADLDDEVVGPLRIGAVSSAIRALLPDVLASLTAQHPRLTPMVKDGEVLDMMPALLTDDLDLLLVESWSNRPVRLPAGVTVRTLRTEDVCVAVGERHPLADRPALEAHELEGLNWASCPQGTESYEALVQALRGHGIEPEIRYLVADYTTQLALVAAHLTAALVPSMAQSPAPPGVRFLALRPALRREVQLVRRGGRQSPPVRACLDALVPDGFAQTAP